MDVLRVRIHNKDEDAWGELGTILIWIGRLLLAFVFLAPLLGALVALGTFLLGRDMHPVFCVLGSLLAAAAIWYAFHTQRWLIMAYGTLYTAVAAGVIFTQLSDRSDPVWASTGALISAVFGLALSWGVYKRHTLARGWAF
jgi:hypothetical protein